jgi:hypothetical protein
MRLFGNALDVEPGRIIIVRRCQQYVVTGVKPYLRR